MSNAILVLGKTGSGKSTGIETLEPKETFLINVVGKELPFRGGDSKYNAENKNYFCSHSGPQIVSALKRINDMKNIKTVVIDDFQYIMSYEFMLTSTGGFEKFNEIAKHAFDVVNTAKSLRDDLTVIFLSHTDETVDSFGQKSYKIKTIGKLLDEKLVIEGLITTVLMAEQREEGDEIIHGFRTKGTPRDTVKSPKGMFDEEFIPNDLQLVLNKIQEYKKG